MKKRFSKLLCAFLATVMVLSMCSIAVFAEETEAAQTEYYAKAGATGDGRTAETPAGSLDTVIKAINADGHAAGDNVTVYIIARDDEQFVYTDAMRTTVMKNMFLPYSPTEHTATITYTSYDEEVLSSMVFNTNYQMSGHTGAHVNLAGPSRFVNMRFIDQRVTSQCDIACHGYDADFIGVTLVSANVGTTIAAGAELPDGTIATADTATVNLLKDTWNGHLRMGTNTAKDTAIINRGGVVRIENSTGIGDVNLGAYSSAVKYMTTTEDVTLYYGAGTLPKLALDSKNDNPEGSVAYNLYKGNVNVVLNGTTVTSFTNLNKNVTGAVLTGALQIIYNNGAVIKSDTATRWADTAKKVPFTNEYHIVAPEGVTVDVTSAAGVYTVTGDKLVYTVSEDGKNIYYSVGGKISIREPGRYTLATADSLDAALAAAGTPTLDEKYQFNAWTKVLDGYYYADYYVKAEQQDGVYYVKHGASGDGLTPATPGSFGTVVAAINQKYKEGDTVTVKVMRSPSNELASCTAAEMKSLAHPAIGDISAHTAMIKLQSADPDRRTRMVWVNNYSTSSGGGNIELKGPITIDDLDVVDLRVTYRWDFYTNAHHLVVGENSKWYCARYSSGSDKYTICSTSAASTFHGGSRDKKTFSTPVLMEFGNGIFSSFSSFSFGGYDEEPNMIFKEDATIKFGTGTVKNLVLNNLKGYSNVFDKNVNLVLNGTKVSAFANLAADITPVIGGALQIIRNNGATVKIGANGIAAYTTTEKTTPTPVWDITVASGSALDVTETAGVYTATGNLVYYVDTVNKKVYYWDDGTVDLTAFGAGTYSLGSAASVQAIPVPDCIEVPDNKRFAGWLEEDAENPGVLVAQIVDKTNNYYVQYGATGSGRSPEFPIGTIPNVIKLINADGLGAGDKATVYLVPTGKEPTNEQLNYSSSKQGEAPIKIDTPNGFIVYQAPNIAHTATITYTTYNYDSAKDNKMILANGDTIKSGNGRDGSNHMFLCGPTVFKDIYVIDLRMDSAAWDFYAQNHNFTTINVDWRRTTGKWEKGVASGNPGPGYTHNSWKNHFYIGNHSSLSYAPNASSTGIVNIENPGFINDLTIICRGEKTGTFYAYFGNDKVHNTIPIIYNTNNNNAIQHGIANLVFNNTKITKIINKTEKVKVDGVEVTKDMTYPTVDALQIVLNNGSSIGTNTAKFNGDVYILKAEDGVILDVTATAGTYTVDVADGMYALATDGENTYHSVIADGVHTLTVPAAGNYTVTATAPYTYENGVVKAHVDGVEVDLASFETENTGKIFLGWQKADGSYADLSEATVVTLNAGETYTAAYEQFSFDSEEADMFVLGAQIRITYAKEEADKDVADLRYISQIKKSFLAEKFGITEYEGGEDVKYGHIVLPAEEKYCAEDDMLEIGKATSAGHMPEMVPAVKIYDNEGDFVKFTICLTGITPEKYTRCFAVRPYIIYTDKNGAEQVIYGEQYETASLVSVAEVGKAKAEEDGTAVPEIIEQILASVSAE